MEKGKFNLDIVNKTVEFESLLNKILPKKTFYKLLLRGRGLEFDSYRTIGPDEDASLIDWKASVRSNNLLTRQYIEERNMNVLFVIDVGENMIFGSQEKLKCEYSAELVSALAHLIIGSGDQVGFVLFNNDIININLPKSGKNQFDILVYDISDTNVYGGISDIGAVLDKLFSRLSPSISMIILVSDFINMDESYKRSFERLGNVFETIAIMIRDPLDKTMPNINKEVLIENYGGEKLLINPSLVKKTYENLVEKQTELVRNIFKSSNIDLLELDTGNSFTVDLANFLKRRVDLKN
ncbi:DUF58 domain-containing protein [Candidatus Pacearchaeota archaeon]|nr:DUF58 domain-containing protein [Candidatus Pacearchaeota archaeon]